MKLVWENKKHDLDLPTKCTYYSLNHENPLLPQVGNKLVNVDGVLGLDPLQHGVQCDEGSCPANTSTAVHQEGVLFVVRVCLPHSLDEIDHGDGICGYSMIRPGQVVEQGHLKGRGIWLFGLMKTQ